MKHHIRWTLALISCCSWASADTVLLPATADTSISARDPGNNFGSHVHAAAGRDGNLGGNSRRALYRFDLTSIPENATLHSAILHLSVVIVPNSGSVASSFELHRLTADWVEGNKTGNNGQNAESGEVTWNNRAHPNTAWTSGAGAQGDFISTASASTAITGTGEYTWSSAQLADDVQLWLDQPAQNFGWLLRSDNEVDNFTARAFGTREAALGDQPMLEIHYTPPPDDVHIEAFTVDSESVAISWVATNNRTYDVLYSRTLTSSNGWRAAETGITAPIGINTWTDAPLPASPALSSHTNLFYRVQSLTSAPPLEVSLEPVASGLTAPLMGTHAGDGSKRFFVVQQTGEILIIDASNTLLPTPFLDVSSEIIANGERGLLGLAFHPDYASNGRFFIHYSAPPAGSEDNLTTIAEYSVSGADSNVADSASAQILLQVEQPQSNHAGGGLAFGPDGYLYLALGDGGGGGDNHGLYGNGQDPSNLLGSIIRIDIDSGFPYTVPTNNPFVGEPGFAPEIYAYGFRNPYRFSFDRGGSNALFVGDVGQSLWEEISIVSAGENHGWRIAEGNFAYDLPIADDLGVDPATLTYPIHNYGRSVGYTVIGGFVYRGNAYPGLVGKYVFGDLGSRLFYLEETRPNIWQRYEFDIQSGGALNYIKGFGEDEDGELYIMTDTSYSPSGTGGVVRRLTKP